MQLVVDYLPLKVLHDYQMELCDSKEEQEVGSILNFSFHVAFIKRNSKEAA